MEACYGGTGVMERPCAVARGIDINTAMAAAVTESGRRRWRRPFQKAGGHYRRPLQEQCLKAGRLGSLSLTCVDTGILSYYCITISSIRYTRTIFSRAQFGIWGGKR